jgi:hypothetical protein
VFSGDEGEGAGDQDGSHHHHQDVASDNLDLDPTSTSSTSSISRSSNRYIPWWNETALQLIEPSKSVLEEGPPGSARSETKRPGKAILIVATIASDRFDHQT